LNVLFSTIKLYGTGNSMEARGRLNE
jgi:hypothetical protein